MSAPLTINPIAYAYFQLRSGIRGTLITCGGVLAVIGALLFLTHMLSGSSFRRIAYDWAHGLLIVQMIVLGLVGSFRVGGAIGSDVKNRMIESNRLMPVPAARAVLGYLVGPSCQTIFLAATLFAVGAVLASAGGIPLFRWGVANMILMVFVPSLWCVVAAVNFIGKGMSWMVTIVGLMTFMSQGMLLEILPALRLFVMPLFGGASFGMSGELGRAEILAMAFQITLGLVAFAAAMRRYRRDDVTALGVVLALLLLLIWVSMSITAVRLPPAETGDLFSVSSSVQRASFHFTLAASMLIGVLAVANATRAWVNGSPRVVLPLSVILAATVVSSGWIFLASDLLAVEWNQTRKLIAVLMVLAFFVGMAGVLGWVYLKIPKGLGIGILWLLATWLLPMLPNSFATVRDVHWPALETLAAVSPIGLMLSLGRAGAIPWVAVGLQWGMAGAICAILLAEKRRQSRALA